MKIKNLKINGFGKVKEKEFEFQDGINLIYGKNESGKSTILKFIISMFYGLTKNKNGGTIPELEKYEPWDNEVFSGKIVYQLDDGETYEVYRDFKKKNPKIFNQNLEEISQHFTIDKTKGNQFFYDQIGLEEEIFTSSIITKQANVRLDEKTQNTVVQKISNILGTGEDTLSYTTMVNKIKKQLNDEVGTANTKERPINIVNSKIETLSKEKIELQSYQNSKFDIEKRINEEKEKIKEQERELERLKRANFQKEKLKENENRIKIIKEMMDTIQEEIEVLQKQKRDSEVQKKTKLPKGKFVILILLILLTITGILVIKNNLIKQIIPVICIIYFIYMLLVYNTIRKNQKKIATKQKELEEKIKILEQNKQRQMEDLKILEENHAKDLLAIKAENHIEHLENLLEKIEEQQRQMNETSLRLHTLEIDNQNILPKLEKLVNIEETLESLQEEKTELEQKGENIKRALTYLEIAYHKMKEQITPKFTQELSNVMKKISNGAYQNVRINTNGELMVEKNNGEYISAENLSIGTIDQLYLSLRLATIKEITTENMPILLDETFAYYDEERLKNILEYLSNEYKEKQVIIFTCTNREKEILDNLLMNYSFIEI